MDIEEKYFHAREQVFTAYSQAKANRVHLEAFRKSKKAILMSDYAKDNPKASIAEQEREAYAHKDYIDLLDGLKVAVEDEAFTYHKLKSMDQWHEEKMDKNATSRKEMGMR